MRIHSHKNFWAGGLFAALGAGFAIGALNYSLGSAARPGPGYFPLGLGVLLFVLGLGLAASAMGRGAPEPKTQPEPEGEGVGVGTWAWRPLLAITAAVILFGVLLPSAGLLMALPTAVVVSSLAESRPRWREVAVSAVVLTAVSYLLFVLGLKLAIPVWPAL